MQVCGIDKQGWCVMRFISSLTRGMQMPVLGKLGKMQCNKQMGNYERAQAMLPVFFELEEDLDLIVNGIGVCGILMVSRQVNPNVPSASKFRYIYSQFKNRFHSDPGYAQYAMRKLPAIVTKYDGDDLVPVISDQDFLDLLTKGAENCSKRE